MADRDTSLEMVARELEGLVDAGTAPNVDQARVLLEPFGRLKGANYEQALDAFDTFLPPRLVRAAKQRQCIVFFGAGVSAEADVPLWWDLLATLGISRDLVTEPELENDPLTAAEVLAYQIGMPSLDEALRAAIKRAGAPPVAHFLLSELFQDVYVTTNYDCLFEDSWEAVHGVRPRVVTTDADLAEIDSEAGGGKVEGRPILFKLHGSVDKENEELILTRSQYRRHYRTNRDMFDRVRFHLGRSNTLFVGFGHRDPEITRLVEDVIHGFELNGGGDPFPPAFYSLQFNMGERTPEIFAARGIVALRPPISLQPPEEIDPRTVALTRSLIDLLAALDSEAHDNLDLDSDLSRVLDNLQAEIDRGIDVLSELAEGVGRDPISVDHDALHTAGRGLGELAGQGIYVLDAGNDTVDSWQPPDLAGNPGRHRPEFRRRPYVKQARMYREPFVSTLAASVFNGNATAFLCVPILDPGKKYRGLVFSAFQVGAWSTPLDLQRSVREAHEGREVSFLLVDSNGILLLPSNLEFSPREAPVDGEPGAANVGFGFESLQRLSRRDKLVERIWNNIVPLSRDDDVLRIGEVELYSVVAEVEKTRWKLALSIPTRSAECS